VIATIGTAMGAEAIPLRAVNSDGRSGLRISVMEPWKFKTEAMQQSGSDEELGSVVLVLVGQHACA
jgi:hypothetical protein